MTDNNLRIQELQRKNKRIFLLKKTNWVLLPRWWLSQLILIRSFRIRCIYRFLLMCFNNWRSSRSGFPQSRLNFARFFANCADIWFIGHADPPDGGQKVRLVNPHLWRACTHVTCGCTWNLAILLERDK